MPLKHKGTPVVFATGTLLVPPLSLAFIEENLERLNSFGGGMPDARLMVDCLHGALLRNYPDVTREQVAELVDLGNMDQVMDAVMKRSGLVSEAEAADEGKPVAASL
jgi:hypothetical protein